MSDQETWSRTPVDDRVADDAALVAALRAGQVHAARWLIERYQDVLFGLCLRMLRHREDAEDVLQETFLRALRAIGRFETGRPLRPWLLGIAANRCRTALQQRHRRPVHLETFEEPADPSRTTRVELDVLEEVARAIERLRPEYRQVFVMYHDQGLPYDEIAVALERPVGTIKTWLHRARAQLADDLSRRGVSCPE